MALPQIESITNSGSNTATTTPQVDYPAYEDGDMVVMFLYIDDDDTITARPPAATGRTVRQKRLVSSGIPVPRLAPLLGLFAWIGTASQSAGSLQWTLGAAEGWVGKSVLFKAGQFKRVRRHRVEFEHRR